MRRTLSICTVALTLLLLSLRMGAASYVQVVPSRGTDTTLDIASWNIEWFGDTSNGPTNEALQLQNARAVIAGADMDIWGVAEIVSLSQWNSLKAQLPGYAGFIAKEPNVVNGSDASSDHTFPGYDGSNGMDTGTGSDASDAATGPQAKAYLVHAAPDMPPLRFCFGLAGLPDGGSIVVTGGFPFTVISKT